MAEQHVFGVKGLYEKRSLEEQRDLSLKAKECKEECIVEMETLKGKNALGLQKKTPCSGFT